MTDRIVARDRERHAVKLGDGRWVAEDQHHVTSPGYDDAPDSEAIDSNGKRWP